MSGDNDFLSRITEVINENLSNEQFGVSELAAEIGMSRSNLLRKIKKLTGLSASRFIRQIRLQQAMELLEQGTVNVSEVSWQVGFNSPSYFIKCFHEEFGYSPGEVGKKELSGDADHAVTAVRTGRNFHFAWTIAIVVVLGLAAYFTFGRLLSWKASPKKSIAVLPFKNDSNDSTNVYLINGLMESVLNNLQKIEDLRVISRTSSEKYRFTDKSIPEIADELDVKYFVEGSGQKIGDQIMLNVQLIDGKEDKHIWAEQYKREVSDIFQLQNEVAKNIARQVEAVITPDEEERIDKMETDNLLAYNLFLKGLDILYTGEYEKFDEAIRYFHQATEEDDQYARAYAALAITYYYLDSPKTEKAFSDSINLYADKALLLDPQLAQSLLAKAMFYINSNAYDLAVPYLEKALEYNPNSTLVIGFLSDFYATRMPDTEKYLEYALKGISLDINALDSVSASFACLHLSNAFIQSGFVDEAVKYINKSLDYFPGNLYSVYVKAYILYAKDKNLRLLNERLTNALQKDPTRADIIQEVAKSFYYLREYDSAYRYYSRFLWIKKTYQLYIYPAEDLKIGYVFSKVGKDAENDSLLNSFMAYAKSDESLYRDLSLSAWYAMERDTANMLRYFQLFGQEEHFQYWILLFLDIDPVFEPYLNLPEFKATMRKLRKTFWQHHKAIRETLEKEGLMSS